jgi:type I restriction enzyme S subunit
MTDAGSGSGELLVLRPRAGDLDSRYLHYLTLSTPFIEWTTATSYGVKMPRTSWDSIGAFDCDPPTPDEQRRIADYLDAETASIDKLIEELSILTHLIREASHQRQSELALRGLGTPTLRESGHEWMGRIPERWRVARLKFEARLESGHTPTRSRPELWLDCTIPWVSLNDVGTLATTEFLTETVNRISEEGLAASSARVLPEGTVVISRDATIGRCGILATPMATSQHFANWICSPTLEPRYLWLVFRTAMQPYFNSLTDGATLRTIGMPDMRDLVVPVPANQEQLAIVESAAEVRERETTVLAEIRLQITRLRERRQALITTAVTRGIDGLPGVA